MARLMIGVLRWYTVVKLNYSLKTKSDLFPKRCCSFKRCYFRQEYPKTQWNSWKKLFVWKFWNMNRNYVLQFRFLSKSITLNTFFKEKRGHENRFKAPSNHVSINSKYTIQSYKNRNKVTIQSMNRTIYFN